MGTGKETRDCLDSFAPIQAASGGFIPNIGTLPMCFQEFVCDLDGREVVLWEEWN